MSYIKKLLSLWFWIIPISLWVLFGFLKYSSPSYFNITEEFLECIQVTLFIVNFALSILAFFESGEIIDNWD